MYAAILTFAIAAGAIIVAGTFLSRAADAIAEATGFGRLLIGSVLLAGATSLPELTVDLSAVRMGVPDLAIGDLLGSCMINLLILAMLDMTHYSRGKMLSRRAVAHSLSGLFFIALMSILAFGLLTPQLRPEWNFLGVHPWLWGIAVSYGLGIRMVYRDQLISKLLEVSQGTGESAAHPRLLPAVMLFVASALMIVVAGPFLADSAAKIAKISGLGETFVGTTLVAFSTSLPELAATFGAMRLGSIDLAIGNIFGSNAFNLMLFVPLDMAHPGSLLAVAVPAHSISAMGCILGTSIVVIGQLYHVERRTPLIEPDSWLVIFTILLALFLVYSA